MEHKATDGEFTILTILVGGLCFVGMEIAAILELVNSVSWVVVFLIPVLVLILQLVIAYFFTGKVERFLNITEVKIWTTLMTVGYLLFPVVALIIGGYGLFAEHDYFLVLSIQIFLGFFLGDNIGHLLKLKLSTQI